MRLSELAAGVPGARVESGGECDIQRIVHDSRGAGPGDLFVAVRGLTVDGHDFAGQAANQGAAVAVERPVELPPATPLLLLSDSRWQLGELAAELHGRPARRLLIAGITGTDGKTTTTHMAAHVLEAAGRRAGYLSTVAFQGGGAASDNLSGQTTTESPDVQAWLARMVAAEVEVAVVEATSHALTQGRVAACDFDVAAITNVGIDHLDYHGSWEDYARAKARLIELCATSPAKAAYPSIAKTAILNHDDISYQSLAAYPIERRWTYSMQGPADVRAVDVEGGAWGSHFLLRAGEGQAHVELRQPARFNVYNALCAAAVCLALGLDLEDVARGLSSFPGVRGRLEPVDLGQPFKVYIDFAHSAGALASALGELRPFAEGRLLAVFGSTGRADHDRPGMGRAAAQGADWFVITTDDPLDEDPWAIAGQIEEGIVGREPNRDFEIVLDRRRAIRRAMEVAQQGDIVLLAGKGHERSMRVGAAKEPWDERSEAEAALRELGYAGAG